MWTTAVRESLWLFGSRWLRPTGSAGSTTRPRASLAGVQTRQIEGVDLRARQVLRAGYQGTRAERICPMWMPTVRAGRRLEDLV